MHKYSDHKYFERKSKWTIKGFLEVCDLEPLERKIECYIMCLENIANNEEGRWRDQANQLLHRYRSGTRPDYQVAKNWDNARKSSINLYQPTFNGNSLGVANISGGTVVIGSKEEATPSGSKRAFDSTLDSDSISPAGVNEKLSGNQIDNSTSGSGCKRTCENGKEVYVISDDDDTLDSSSSSDSFNSDNNNKKQKIDKGKKREDTEETRSTNVPRTPSPRPIGKTLIITPQKPTLSEKSAQYLPNHITINTNEQHAILKTDEVSIKIPDVIYNWLIKVLMTDKKEFKNAIMAQIESDCEDHHHFRQVCEIILYDFYHMTRLCPLNRNINERTYTVERIAPLFKALQSEYPGYKFSWIEIEVKSIKEMLKIFPDFDLVINKADGIGIKVSCNQAVVFIEVSGSPSKPEEKHIKDDAEKLLKEATFGLVSLLRNYLGKPAEMAKNVHIYMIQCIGDRITLSEFSLNEKHRYKTSQIKSARLPFSFAEVADYLEIFELLHALIDGLESQTKELHKLRLSSNDCVPKVKDWLWVPDTTATWQAD